MKKLLKTKLHSRKLIKEINTQVVPLVRYSGSFLIRTREELQQMDQKTRKLITMRKALYPIDDRDRLAMTRRLHKKKNKERLITVSRNNKNNTRVNRTTIIRKQKWEET